MKSLILQTTSKLLLPLLLLFSFFLLFRGHNEPGGGFVGGLVASAAFSLYAIAFGMRKARHTLGIPPGMLIGSGLLTALIAGILPLWTEIKIPVIGKLSTPLLFDIGVYQVVLGVTLVIILTLGDE
jgi:multicomponent Na+:H+ antiporter subunit B